MKTIRTATSPDRATTPDLLTHSQVTSGPGCSPSSSQDLLPETIQTTGPILRGHGTRLRRPDLADLILLGSAAAIGITLLGGLLWLIF